MNICPIPTPLSLRPVHNGPSVHRAGWVVAEPWRIHRNGYVHVEGGIVKAIGTGVGPKGVPVIDHGPGVLTPALVNAHTHLELSALKGLIPLDGGFQAWVAQLLQKRGELTPEAISVGILKGTEEILESGCAVVGDISTLGASWEILQQSGLSGVCFAEYLGNTIPDAVPFRKLPEIPLYRAAAGHAPHTTSPALLFALKQMSRKEGLPMSIHLSESEVEVEFITGANGNWADFLSSRGIDFSNWGLPAASPVSHLDHLGILDDHTLAVHLIYAGREDFELLGKRGVSVCVCPRSNLALHQKLPDLMAMAHAGLNLCLGTDSLASTPSLTLWEEIKLTADRFPLLSADRIWAMVTCNGARALGLGDRLGALTPGFLAAMIYLPIAAAGATGLLEKIVNGDFDPSLSLKEKQYE